MRTTGYLVAFESQSGGSGEGQTAISRLLPKKQVGAGESDDAIRAWLHRRGWTGTSAGLTSKK